MGTKWKAPSNKSSTRNASTAGKAVPAFSTIKSRTNGVKRRNEDEDENDDKDKGNQDPGQDSIRRSKRARREAMPRYLKDPVYGPLISNNMGASSMTVVLGPAAGDPRNRGSVPLPDTPPVMQKLHQEEPGKWVAGHLLNADLGGPGIAINLTPLSSSGAYNQANHYHSSWETVIKNAVIKAKQIAEYGANDNQDYWYGVLYEVTVVTHGRTQRGGVPYGIKIKASLKKRRRRTNNPDDDQGDDDFQIEDADDDAAWGNVRDNFPIKKTIKN